jgi:hypothetical protein
MKAKVLLPLVLLVVVLIGAVVYHSIEARPPSSEGRTAEVKVKATELFAEFQRDELEAGKRYNDKLVEVAGTVRAINPRADGTEVLLETGDPMGAVVCDFRTGEMPDLAEGVPACIQGYCAGYNMDVLLQRCSITQ